MTEPTAETPAAGDGARSSGATYAALRRPALRRAKANPEDPDIPRPPMGKGGLMAGPDGRGSPGRTAIVQGQVYLVAVIVLAQLWLITTALLELLSGRPHDLDLLALVSGAGLALALVIWQWPRRRALGR
ncbi:MAG TPA: hypothetical protein VF808_14350 [Ktedonobacterales bacterium]